MSVYMKNFVFASLFYLGLATIFGVLNGVADLGYWGIFAHSHFNLLGFMSMIVFGIGYFILPRFNGTNLRFESWIPIHFYLGNISLIGMVVFRGLAIRNGSDLYQALFVVMATLQVISIFMFIINIWITLTPGKKEATPEKPKVEAQPKFTREELYSMPKKTAKTNIAVTPQSKIGELVDTLPELQKTFIECGLLELQMPGHIDKVKQMGITIETACLNHSLDLDQTILAVEKKLKEHGFSTSYDYSEPTPAPSSGEIELGPDLLIGDLISSYPQVKDTFQKYFGSGCFECPGQSYESIDLACRMHGVDPEQFIKELKQII